MYGDKVHWIPVAQPYDRPEVTFTLPKGMQFPFPAAWSHGGAPPSGEIDFYDLTEEGTAPPPPGFTPGPDWAEQFATPRRWVHRYTMHTQEDAMDELPRAHVAEVSVHTKLDYAETYALDQVRGERSRCAMVRDLVREGLVRKLKGEQ